MRYIVNIAFYSIFAKLAFQNMAVPPETMLDPLPPPLLHPPKTQQISATDNRVIYFQLY